MISRRPTSLHALAYALLVFSLASGRVAAQEAFDCKITIGDSKWDLTSLNTEYMVSRERNTPPTKFRDSVTFNLCADLTAQDGVAEKDQCPKGTRACLTKINLKESESDRITAVIPLAKSSKDDVKTTAIRSPGKGISLVFAGPTYPDPLTGQDVPQSFRADIICDTEVSPPKFESYDGKELFVTWHSKAGCEMGAPPEPSPTNPDDGKDDKVEEPTRSVGSGIGYFFLLLILALVTYFGLGAYYNYSTYGATGYDLIPHRDFWREVPYMLRDVVSHLCSTVRPRRSSRGGYIAV